MIVQGGALARKNGSHGAVVLDFPFRPSGFKSKGARYCADAWTT